MQDMKVKLKLIKSKVISLKKNWLECFLKMLHKKLVWNFDVYLYLVFLFLIRLKFFLKSPRGPNPLNYSIYFRNGGRSVAALAEKKDVYFTFLQMKTFLILRYGNVSHSRTKYIYFNDHHLVIQISIRSMFASHR